MTKADNHSYNAVDYCHAAFRHVHFNRPEKAIEAAHNAEVEMRKAHEAGNRYATHPKIIEAFDRADFAAARAAWIVGEMKAGRLQKAWEAL